MTLLYFYFICAIICWLIEIFLYFYLYEEIQKISTHFYIYIRNADPLYISFCALMKALIWPVIFLKYPALIIKWIYVKQDNK